MPITRGRSGPIITRAIFSFLQKSAISSKLFKSSEIFSNFSSNAVPALPGQTKTLVTASSCEDFHARACSLPPEPMTRTFISV